ncbi:MAG: nucleoside recognition protein, partial [Verrucomicrobiota bacterium]|nr:nucleoside recognition protein [Verrucomicrobiota bacterium]
MLNYIWLGLILFAVLVGGYNDVFKIMPAHGLKEVTEGAFEATKTAVLSIALPLIGIMALWLGLMRLAEKSGLIEILAKLLRPVMRRLFPDVPPNHPAMGSMLMNLAANMLGLANAATPLGLRAMNDLEKLNPRPGTATNAMCTFLAVNTSSIQLIPATALGILVAAGSKNPTAIVGTSLLATICSTVAGITAVKLLEKLPAFRLPPAPVSAAQEFSATETMEPRKESLTISTLQWWGKFILIAFAAFFVWLFVKNIQSASASHSSFILNLVSSISVLAVPFLLAFFPLYAALRRVKVYEEFVEGAKEGFQVAVKVIPFLVAILVAVGMFRAAGGIDLLSKILKPVLDWIHFPTELVPITLMRPLSGSATTGLFTELVKTWGPDHLITRMAGTIFGSTETTFYVIAVYFGAVAIRRTRHAI